MKDVFKEKTPYASDKVGFGIYHFGQGGVDMHGYQDNNVFAYHGHDRDQCNYQESLDYMNFYSYHFDEESFLHLHRIREEECVTWMHYLPFTKVYTPQGEKFFLKPDWKEDITRQVEACKKAGLWETVAGFNYDEPLLRFDGDTFEEFTQFMSTFGKRQFAVFSLYEIKEGTHPRSNDPEFGMKAHVINKSNTRYLTDIGYDVYHRANFDEFREYNDIMFNDIQRDDIYYWGFPCTWKTANFDFTEDWCLENLDMHRKLLDEVKNPGGLFCYTWRSWRNKGESLDYLFDTENPNRWNRLQDKMIEMGKELKHKKLNPIK